MNERTISGISISIMYALLILACFGVVESGFITSPRMHLTVLSVPVWVQFVPAQAIGPMPLLQWAGETTHWASPYIITLATSFYALYWIGWWIARIDE